jgi:hypothetical protein
MMVHNAWYYWVSGVCPSSGILKNTTSWKQTQFPKCCLLAILDNGQNPKTWQRLYCSDGTPQNRYLVLFYVYDWLFFTVGWISTRYLIIDFGFTLKKGPHLASMIAGIIPLSSLPLNLLAFSFTSFSLSLELKRNPYLACSYLSIDDT